MCPQVLLFFSFHLKTSSCLKPRRAWCQLSPLTLCCLCPGTAARGAEFAQSAPVCWFWVLFPALPLKMNTGSVPLPEVCQGGCESSSLHPTGHFSPPGSLLNKANKPQLFPAQGAPCLQRIPKPRFQGLGFFSGTPETAPFWGVSEVTGGAGPGAVPLSCLPKTPLSPQPFSKD